MIANYSLKDGGAPFTEKDWTEEKNTYVINRINREPIHQKSGQELRRERRKKQKNLKR